MQEQNETYFLQILLWNLMLQLAIIHSFVQNAWVVHNPCLTRTTQEKILLSLEFLRPCAIHKNLYWQKVLCLCVHGCDYEWCPAWCSKKRSHASEGGHVTCNDARGGYGRIQVSTGKTNFTSGAGNENQSKVCNTECALGLWLSYSLVLWH